MWPPEHHRPGWLDRGCRGAWSMGNLLSAPAREIESSSPELNPICTDSGAEAGWYDIHVHTESAACSYVYLWLAHTREFHYHVNSTPQILTLSSSCPVGWCWCGGFDFGLGWGGRWICYRIISMYGGVR